LPATKQSVAAARRPSRYGRAGVAVRNGDGPAIHDADVAGRCAARSISPIKLATAGIHFAKVLERLGVA
jgi:hypothetical protein